MESNQFWAFFVIALIAGASIALVVSNSMTGYNVFTDMFKVKPFEPIPEPPLTPIVINPVVTSIPTGTSTIGCENCMCVPRNPSPVTLAAFDDCMGMCGNCLTDSACCTNCYRGIGMKTYEQILAARTPCDGVPADLKDDCINWQKNNIVAKTTETIE